MRKAFWCLLVRYCLSCREQHVGDVYHVKTERCRDRYNTLTPSVFIIWFLYITPSQIQWAWFVQSCEEWVYSKKLPTLKQNAKCPQEVKFLCAWALKGKITGVNFAEASQSSPGSSTHWAPFHRGTHRGGLVLRPTCGSVPAGHREMIGLLTDAAQRAPCLPTAKASTGMQYGAAGNVQFTAYLFIENLQIPKKPPPAFWHFGGNSGTLEADLAGIPLRWALVS